MLHFSDACDLIILATSEMGNLHNDTLFTLRSFIVKRYLICVAELTKSARHGLHCPINLVPPLSNSISRCVTEDLILLMVSFEIGLT